MQNHFNFMFNFLTIKNLDANLIKTNFNQLNEN